MIARAFIKQNPYEIWGDGSQIRNWTFVDDIVEGTILAAEEIKDGSAINLGTMERISVRNAAQMAIEFANYSPKIKFRKDMPTGPLNRVADNSLAKRVLGWEPKVKFKEGFRLTAEWYFEHKSKDEVKKNINTLLLNR
jgi:nucleoside-diphosphate-sugar epimerase